MDKEPKLLFVWHSQEKIKTISLNRKTLTWIGVSIVASVFLLIFISIISMSNLIYKSRFALIRKNNSQLVSTIYDFRGRIQEMEKEVNALVEKDKALRTYANIPSIDRDIRTLGIGGKVQNRPSEMDQLLPTDSIKISNLESDLDKLSRVLKFEKLSYETIYQAFKHRTDQIQATPSIRPVQIGYITDGFGYRKDPFTSRRQFHYGVDISAPNGTSVFATADGVVEYAGPFGTYGRVIRIDHGYGYTTLYAHLSRMTVNPGQVVKRGQKIGEVGTSGRSTGPHLHYEVCQYKIYKNPLDYYFTGYSR
ncbi:MAG: M23 family metallopeptidase [Candidatus Neomarinimicrobiota bacterium]